MSIMKKIMLMTAIALVALGSCKKETFNYGGNGADATGTLSFDGLAIEVSDETHQVKASTRATTDTYAIYVDSEDGQRFLSTTYNELKGSIQLPAGKYTLTAQSATEIPDAEFENPVYGATKEFTIEAGKTTSIGTLTCTLLQCKVSVAYNEDFLAMVTGNCTTTVELSNGSPLEYAMTYSADKGPQYEKRNGYFAVNGSTLTVTFRGEIEGKSQRMTKSFKDIAPRQWRQITFVQKINGEGDATFDITISDYVEDETLDNDINGNETILGEDPNAPTGDGGIKLVSTCDYDISNPIVVPAKENPFTLTMNAVVPNGVKRFTVEIESTNPDFTGSVASVNGGQTTLDLVNPSSGAIDVFTNLIPFPYGSAVEGKTEIPFDLSAAQVPILGFIGSHTFKMIVIDKTGCRNEIPVVLVVE